MVTMYAHKYLKFEYVGGLDIILMVRIGVRRVNPRSKHIKAQEF